MHLKNTGNWLSALVLLILSQQAHAQALPELQPRDLDGDTSTIEAYYFQPQDITWLADSNLGKSNAFGLERGGLYNSDGTDNFSIDIDFSGQMFKETVDSFISAVNQNNYLGNSSWRLPTAISANCDAGGDNCTGAEAPDFNQVLVANFGGSTASQFPELNDERAVWLGSFGATGRQLFSFGTTDRGRIGQLGTCPIMDGVRNCQPAVVWLVHDGDIGTSVNTSECIDTEPMNDGWGWDGVESCRIGNVMAAECIDSAPVGDGWGWDGVTSCRIDATPTCVDTPPANDGWGWDGSSSCRIEVVNPVCVDSPPVGDGWGWNGIESCRVFDPAVIQTNCVDTAPEGDGWGWDGVASCRI